jgi:type IV pilus assembly protein PilY1
LGTTNVISAINVVDAGLGYVTTPTLSLSGVGSGVGASWTVVPAPYPVQAENRPWDGTGSATTTMDYFTKDSNYPSGYLPDSGGPLAVGATVIPYPNTASSSTAEYPKFKNRTDCGGETVKVCTWEQERQNYANWKTYHSTRLDLAKTGIGLAFQPLNPTFRLGWGTINTLESFSRLDSGVRTYNPAVQTDFLDWLYKVQAVGNTPNRIALDKVGQYYQRSDDNGPWADAPTGDKPVASSAAEVKTHASCRRSYALLMTDGYYNDSFTIADQDTSDGPSITKPIAYQYRPVGPYSDTKDGTKFANSFADVAMKYWVNDLRPNLDNKVRSIAADEAFWQHMNFYAIGLGINGDLNASDPAVLASLSGPNRTRDWPKPATDSRNSIDDMWHATINGRGKMLNAKTSDELNRSLQQMMATIGADETTQSGVAVSTASLTSNTKKYTPRYTPITWTGNVTAYLLDSTTGAQSSVAWEVETEVGTDTTTGAKIYKSNMPAAADRKIFVGTGASSGTKAVPFTYADMNTAGLTSAMNGTVNDALVKYLRGDPTNEHSSATTSSSSAIYRGRATRLGDIVNSTPVFVKDTLDLRYEMLPMATPGQSTYRDHVDLKKKRPEGVLFVGANDGMLHGFRDGTATNPGGIETFAYVPNALLPTLNQLADKTYVHRFYVDGPNTETDAYFTGGTPRWANVVIGSTGAGAGAAATPGVSPRTAIFALDVTSLNTSVTSLNASSALWEISSSKSDFSELGYVLSDIQSGPTLDGKWVAIFGNGYESKSCQARLFVVDLETGALIKEINTNKGDCSTAKNGLGGVRIMRNSNQQIIGVYAGDLLGNLWKFSLNDASPSNWKVDLGGSPLFPAGPTQPITAAPAVVTLDSTSVPTKGYIVIAGTGKFYEVSDIKSTDLQTVYGVWDSVPFGTTTIPAGAALTDKSLLVQQTILAPQVINGNTFFSISQNEVDYEGKTMPPRRGWYLDLNNTGQRLVYPMDVLANRFVVVDSISPANISLDPCANTSSGTGYLYVINALTGAGPTEAVLDTNGDGNVTSADGTSAGRGGGADGRNVTLDIEKTAAKQTYVNLSGGSPGGTLITLTCTLLKNCPEEYGTKFKSREWRQLFMR